MASPISPSGSIARPRLVAQQPPQILPVARLGEHRPGHRADRHGRRDAGAGRPAEQERREHNGASRARVLAAHRGEAPVEEELAGARLLQERAVDREQDDERARDVDRGAEDPLERLVEESRQARDVVAAVRPLAGQPRPGERVGDESADDAGHDPSGRAAAGLEHEHDERDAEERVRGARHHVAVPDVVTAREEVGDRREAEHRADDVPPHEAVAIARGDREQQEHEHQHEADVHRAQHLRRHDVDGRVQVVEAHDDEQRRRQRREQAAEAARRALVLLDERLGGLQALLADGLVGGRAVVARFGTGGQGLSRGSPAIGG